jgi:hypothetical protein
MVPTVLLPPVTPSTDQVTDVSLLPVTVTVNCCVLPVNTVAEVGLIETFTPEVTVTVALALFVESALLVAVTV